MKPFKLYIIILVALTYGCKSGKLSDTPQIKDTNHYSFKNINGTLVGKIPISHLYHNKDFKWFKTNYHRYKVKEALASKLKPYLSDNIKIDVYLGTWCGDTKRLLPKFIKVLNSIDYSPETVNYYALNKQKQSLHKIDEALNIKYVPTIIIYKEGKEFNRIVERHVVSLESDLLSILSNNEYNHYLFEK